MRAFLARRLCVETPNQLGELIEPNYHPQLVVVLSIMPEKCVKHADVKLSQSRKGQHSQKEFKREKVSNKSGIPTRKAPNNTVQPIQH